jgi:hypothetical protein
VRRITTVPSPKTSMSAACGSTLPPPLIQCVKPATFAPAMGLAAVRAAHSRSPISKVAFGSEPSWPVWSAWKWLMPTYFTCSGRTCICASCSSSVIRGALGFDPGR